ncbi:MAG: D-alanyl-D-alanine carboxypeptidase family protein, partial [bacterium]|nr:D-alanyl-D-alanine carboxypeptidase family protein [bacterium]
MKKILLFFISAALAASLVACVREVNPTDDGSKTNEKVTEGDVDIDETSNPVPSNDPDDIPAEDNKDDNNDANTDDKTDEETLPDISGLPDENGFVAVSAIMLDRYESTLHVGQIDMPWETIYPQNATNASTYWESSDPSVASVDTYGRITANKEGTCTVTVTSYSNPEISSVVNVTVTPSPLPSEPTYIDGIIIANKSYPLPSDYNPGVDPEAQSALDSMIAAASKDGISLFTVSAFRSYERQQTLYSNYLLREGRDAADRYSARPGYS